MRHPLTDIAVQFLGDNTAFGTQLIVYRKVKPSFGRSKIRGRITYIIITEVNCEYSHLFVGQQMTEATFMGVAT